MLRPLLRSFLACEKGATAIEYAFIAALIFLAIAASLIPIGNKVGATFNNVANKV